MIAFVAVAAAPTVVAVFADPTAAVAATVVDVVSDVDGAVVVYDTFRCCCRNYC